MSIVTGARGSAEADEEHVRAGDQLGWDWNYAVEVPARTLDSVLEESGAPRVDLLSLGVEGYESQVLRGLSFDKHAPRLIQVEALEPERRAELKELLVELYELADELSPYDLLSRRRS